MENSSLNSDLNYRFDYPSHETTNLSIFDFIRTVGAKIPALMTVQECNTMSNIYINEYGCRFLKHSVNQLLEMEQKYFSQFFPPEEVEFNRIRLQDLVKKNNLNKTISFFQRIRPNEKKEYSWFFTTSQLSFSSQKELLLMNISLPIKKLSYMGEKLDSEVERNLFSTQNRFLYERLSKREKEIIRLISKGISSQKISNLLSISIHTVNNHRKNIISKIGKKNLFNFLKFNSV